MRTKQNYCTTITQKQHRTSQFKKKETQTNTSHSEKKDFHLRQWLPDHKRSKSDFCSSQVHNTWTKKSLCGSKMDHNRVNIDSPDNNRGSKVDNGWMRGSSQKDSHRGSKVDCNGWHNTQGSQVDTKGRFRNHKGSKLDYCGSQVHNSWTKNSSCGSNMDHIKVDNINYKQKYEEILYCNQAKKQKENKKKKSKEKTA